VTSPTADELTAWLDRVHAPGFFRFHFDNASEAAAFTAAVSRKIDRDRPARAAAWSIRASSGDVAIVLNESACQIAARVFSPLPVRSRIPHTDAPALALRLFDESSSGGQVLTLSRCAGTMLRLMCGVRKGAVWSAGVSSSRRSERPACLA